MRTHTAIALCVAISTLATHTVYMMFPVGRVAEEVFYVMRGMNGAVVFFALAYFAFRPTVRRFPTGLLFVTCAFGAYEESLTMVCGLPAIGERLQSKNVVAAMDGLCGAITGIPWALAEACLIALFLLLFAVMKSGQQQRRASDDPAA